MTNDDKTWDDKTNHDNPVAPPFPTAGQVAETLLALHEKLMASPMLKKGAEWKDDWEGWDRGTTWQGEKLGIYLLWGSEGAPASGEAPVYVGEGQLGKRINDSFHGRTTWNYAQILVDDRISGTSKLCKWWRKALERFVILALMPEENKD